MLSSPIRDLRISIHTFCVSIPFSPELGIFWSFDDGEYLLWRRPFARHTRESHRESTIVQRAQIAPEQ